MLLSKILSHSVILSKLLGDLMIMYTDNDSWYNAVLCNIYCDTTGMIHMCLIVSSYSG